jgi:hypothetical protein
MTDPLGEALARLLAPILKPLLKQAVAEALAEHVAGERAQPEYVDCATMAQLVDCSQAQIHRLCHEGLPFVRLGEVKRFRPAAVYEWLEARTVEHRGKG